MSPDRARRVAWVAAEIMPHEPAVRAWLIRSRLPVDQVDDLIQEAYCRFSALASVDHIALPKAYFFQVARSLLADKIRRSRIINIETVTELDALPVFSDEPSPERIVLARRELAEVMRLISALPGRCRKVFELRKIEGLSQREIASRLGITETMVENDVVKGMRIISTALRQSAAVEPGVGRPRIDGEPRNRRRH